jgi:polyisoprenoid-binding protein YceI
MSTWNLDQAHSTIGFKVKHLMVSTVRGMFTDFTGTIESSDDSFENAHVHFTAQTASIHTANTMRDDHLKSADFFDAAQFPTVSFASTSFVKNGNGFTMTGDLTMHGVTKSVTLQVTSDGIGNGMDGKRVAGFDITGTINRQDFGLTWNAALETGGVVVSEEVAFDIHVEAKEA